METFVAVFSNPDPESPSVFWGAFTNTLDANNAIAEWIESHPYWELEDFSVSEHPFGVLL